jgi:hypothetical protein
MLRLFVRLGMILYFILLVTIVALAWSDTAWAAAKLPEGVPASNVLQPLVKVVAPVLIGVGVVSLFKWAYGSDNGRTRSGSGTSRSARNQSDGRP